MTYGMMILWRFKKDAHEYRFGFVIDFHGELVEIGKYNGARNGLFVKMDEIEWKKYVK